MNNCLDLFCGIGGFSISAEDAGMNVVGAIDFDEDVLDTYEDNFESVDTLNADLTKMTEDELQSWLPVDSVDVVVASPPCNTVSKVNRSKSRPTSAIPVTGWLINKLNPSIFVFENVPHLKHQYDGLIDKFKLFVENEYEISSRILNAADYGTPQHRLRYMMIGIRNDQLLGKRVQFPRPTHGKFGEKDHVTAGEALESVPNPENPEEYRPDAYYELLKDIPPALNYSFYTEKRGCPEPKWEWRQKFSDFLRKDEPDSPCRTLKANDGGGNGPFHWNNRRFTKEELKRLQGFPQEFEIPSSRNKAKLQLGKAIPPQLGYYCIRAAYLQSKLRPSLIDSDMNLDVYARKRTDSDELQSRAEERYDELRW